MLLCRQLSFLSTRYPSFLTTSHLSYVISPARGGQASAICYKLSASLLIERNKSLYRSIIDALNLGWEKATGKLSSISMISHALAALTLSAAGLVCARATFFIFFKCALHNILLTVGSKSK